MTSTPVAHPPVAVVGGGPIGLAAAAHLAARGMPTRLYEAGPHVAASVLEWGHVRLFTPWRYCVDPIAAVLLERSGWSSPDPEACPTGDELVADYLRPLSVLPELRSTVEVGARVTAITRRGMDKVVSRGRETRSFALSVSTAAGVRVDLARAVIDASGTWTRPNPLGADGLAVAGEVDLSDRVAYGIPDVLGRDRASYAGRTTLVVGSGHSAANALLDLARLGATATGTRVLWAVRAGDPARAFGGGSADQLPARGSLGADLRRLVDDGRVRLTTAFPVKSIRREGDRLFVSGGAEGERTLGPVDRVVVATGQRPDLDLTRELRLDLDPWLESTRALGPMIDPNLHSCGSVPPHGHRELAHPESGFYTVGIKSYGRAPTFLMLTGYEQVRSVVAALTGDAAAADDVRLELPETGVCSVSSAPAERCCPSTAAGADRSSDPAAGGVGRAGCGCGQAA